MNTELLIERIYEAYYGNEHSNLIKLLKTLKKLNKGKYNDITDELGITC